MFKFLNDINEALHIYRVNYVPTTLSNISNPFVILPIIKKKMKSLC
jgi:hypothetical protein